MRATLLVALCLPLLGCPPSADDDGPSGPEASYCEASDSSSNETREVEIGEQTASGFVPWSDGQDVRLQTGGQGGTMVVVALRVPAAAADGDQTCWVVTLDNEVAGADAGEIGDLKSAYVFLRDSEHMQVDGIYDLLGYGSDGLADHQLTLGAEVNAAGFTAAKAITASRTASSMRWLMIRADSPAT